MHTNSIIALSHVRMHVGMQAVEGILGVGCLCTWA